MAGSLEYAGGSRDNERAKKEESRPDSYEELVECVVEMVLYRVVVDE